MNFIITLIIVCTVLPLFFFIGKLISADIFLHEPEEKELISFLRPRGFEFLSIKETKANEEFWIQENWYLKSISYKKYYLVSAKSIKDNSEKEYHLILRGHREFFSSHRDFFYFEM